MTASIIPLPVLTIVRAVGMVAHSPPMSSDVTATIALPWDIVCRFNSVLHVLVLLFGMGGLTLPDGFNFRGLRALLC